MKKSVVIIVFVVLVIMIGLVSSQNDSGGEDMVEKGYACLEEQIENKGSLSLQESIFGTLALGGNSKAEEVITSEKKVGEDCWPKSGCKIKDTAQVLLVQNRLAGETEGIERWLLSKNASATDLTWYLQIDIQSHNPTSCTVTYDGTGRSIKIQDDLKLSGNPGSCLSITSNGYWMKISSSCLDKTFEVSCEEDFITNLLYERSSGGTIYVSSATHSGSSLGTTEERVNARCFRTGTACDYEGSLWAALALQQRGFDPSEFSAYLIALSEDNKKFFPNAFLFLMNGGNDNYGEIVQSQKQSQYWQQSGTPYNRFYDTSLGMLALSGSGQGPLADSKNYILGIQQNSGCWNSNNIRDTGFILYSGWPKLPIGSSGGNGGTGIINNTNGSGGGGGGGGIVNCEQAGHFCSSASACNDGGGNILFEFECVNDVQYCCTVQPFEQTCSQQGGIVCSIGQECSTGEVQSTDGACCLTSCHEESEEDTCSLLAGGVCRTSCFADENSDEFNICPNSEDVCCIISSGESGGGKDDESGGISAWVWIFILLILILLVILGIVYRDKIKTWWNKFRSRKKKPLPQRGAEGIVRPGRPGPRFGGPPMGHRRPLSRPIVRPQRPQGPRPIAKISPPRREPPSDKKDDKSEKGSDYEETMKKLREMSK